MHSNLPSYPLFARSPKEYVSNLIDFVKTMAECVNRNGIEGNDNQLSSSYMI